MPNLNQVNLIGNVTRDIELKHLPSQTTVADFGLAINRKWKAKDGQSMEEVCYVDCSAFGKTGEVIHQYVKKGNPLFVSGRLKYETWEDKTGGKRSKLKVIVEEFQFLANNNARQGGEYAGEPDAAAAPAAAGRGPSDDDLPF